MNMLELEDLKQFIDTRLSQSEVHLTTKFDARFDELNQKMDDGFSGVGDALEQMNDEHDKAHDVINRRLLRLEQA